ncbi:hypothetical protein AVEN_126668-1 [Araneus ventricosus]|uniref:Uncharacterized protein n=1 Tax=Araneus ventricosus TaxID=182803 RepID=A0A4Y2NK31_ARAVE|nr:hypothetical protein AVEN_126668-1 [Araneus ventricosus]
MVLRIMVIKSTMRRSCCCRRRNDEEEKMEYRRLFDSCQVGTKLRDQGVYSGTPGWVGFRTLTTEPNRGYQNRPQKEEVELLAKWVR